MVIEIWGVIKKISVTSIIFLQHFYNKSHVISYYQFKFEFNIEITFFNLTITICHLKFVVKILSKLCAHIILKKKKVEWNCGNGIAEFHSTFHNSKFFFLPHYFGNGIATNQLQIFFSLLFRQCHCHNSIPPFFLRNDMCIQFLQYFYNKF